MKNHFFTSISILLLATMGTQKLTAQVPLLETGSVKPMPNEWVDKDTHHKVIKLTRTPGSNSSFYFHNNPFIENKMVYYNAVDSNRQIYTVDMTTLATEQITSKSTRIGGEIAAPKGHNVFYQSKDSVFCTNIDTKQTKLIFVFPEDYKGNISTLNANETILAGAKASDAQKEILKNYPEKSQFFNRIYDAHLPNDLFTIDIKTKTLKKIHTENTWLGHVQFSPTDPDILSFCHEGPWHKVDRIWIINLKTDSVRLMHKRTMDMEIAGHEFFATNGKAIWFDLQMPRGETFYLGTTDLYSLKERKYQMTRDEWSIHFNVSKKENMFCGDGGNDTQVAKAKDGMWIYLFKPNGDKFVSERLVNMKHHDYKLEPNVHFTPDEKWIVFRANFEGESNVYAVEIEKS